MSWIIPVSIPFLHCIIRFSIPFSFCIGDSDARTRDRFSRGPQNLLQDIEREPEKFQGESCRGFGHFGGRKKKGGRKRELSPAFIQELVIITFTLSETLNPHWLRWQWLPFANFHQARGRQTNPLLRSYSKTQPQRNYNNNNSLFDSFLISSS